MFQFRALKKNGGSCVWHKFSLSDCPVLLWEDTIILQGAPNTPLLLINSVTRGHPEKEMFEGDIVCDSKTNERLGIVIYDNGFYLQKFQENFKKINIPDHIYIEIGNQETIEFLNTIKKTPILFKSGDTEFSILDLVCISGDIIKLILRTHKQKVNINTVCDLLYFNEETDIRKYYGDIISGDFLTFDNVTEVMT